MFNTMMDFDSNDGNLGGESLFIVLILFSYIRERGFLVGFQISDIYSFISSRDLFFQLIDLKRGGINLLICSF